MNSVYLDHNAGAPLRPPVREAMREALEAPPGNPSSVHGFGRAARGRLERARAAVAALVGAEPAQVVFTSGGTEANALALALARPEAGLGGGGAARAVLVSAVEHDSVLAAAPQARRLAVGGSGVLDLDGLEQALAATSGPVLLSLMLANNETGVLQPVAAAAARVHAWGGLVHCDAVQAVGRIPVDMAALGVDLLSLSAHKLGGPTGSGALVVADSVTLPPLICGGGQERGRRAGTENLLGVVGFGVAAALAAREAAGPGLLVLRQRLEAGIAALTPQAVIPGAGVPRLGNTTCVCLPGVAAATLVMALDLAGIAVSAGAACSSGRVRPSHVLAAMGLPASWTASAIRISLGWNSAAADVDVFLRAWEAVTARLGKES